MGWYAADAVTDALEATREFLLPFDLRRWARLAVIVFFVSGGGGGGGGNGGTQSFSNAMGDGVSAVDGGGVVPALVLVLLAGVLVLALAFALVASVMRFVLVDALRTGEVRLLGPFTGRLRQGLGLFAFHLALFAAVAIPVALLVGVPWLLLGRPEVGVLLAIPLLLLLGFPVAIVGGLTVDFAVPVAIAADVGILAAWRRLWPAVRAEWQQVAVYLVLKFVLGWVLGLVVGLLLAVVAIPLGAVGIAAAVTGFAVGDGLGLLGVALLLAVLIPLGLLLFVAVLAVRIPVTTYLGYFALLVVGDLDEDFDLIAERRAAIRTGD